MLQIRIQLGIKELHIYLTATNYNCISTKPGQQITLHLSEPVYILKRLKHKTHKTQCDIHYMIPLCMKDAN